MTVSSTINREQYATNGVTTAFTIHFPFFDDTDVNAAWVDSNGNVTDLALNTDFTVTGGDGSGGTLTTTGSLSPLAGSGSLTIYREIPFTQETDYVEDDPLPADTLEGDVDRAVMRDQQLKDGQDRALTFPVTIDPSVSAELPQPTADLLLGWKSDASGLENKVAGSLGLLMKASQIAAQAATNDTDYMTPLTTKQQLDYRGRAISIKDYGAKCDGQVVTLTVSITSGTAALAVDEDTFVAADVGKLIAVPGAGAAGAVLYTTIAAFTDTKHIMLGANASTTVAAVSSTVVYGTDDLAAWNAALAAATVAPQARIWPVEFLGKSTISATLTIPAVANMAIEGFGGGREGPGISRQVPSKLIPIFAGGAAVILDAGNGGIGNAIPGLRLRHFGIDGVYPQTAGMAGLRLNKLVQDSKFEDLQIANVTTGLNALASCFSNVYRDIDFYVCTSFGMRLQELDHDSEISKCKFRNESTGTDTPTNISIGDGGSGSFHASVVNIMSCSFNCYRVVRWVDAQDAHAVNLFGCYMEGSNASMSAGITFGRSSDANKKVDGATIIGGRITTGNGSPAAYAIDCQRVSGLVVEGVYFDGWTTSALKIDHTNSDNIRWGVNDSGSVVIADSDGPALIVTRRAVSRKFTTGNIADDGVFSFTPFVNAGEIALITPSVGLAFQGKAIYLATGGGAGMLAGTVGANFTVNTTAGTLTGTTGTDGNVTIRANTDGKIYIENRSGSTRNFTYYITD